MQHQGGHGKRTRHHAFRGGARSREHEADILADKGYIVCEREARLNKQGWCMHIQRKGSTDQPISEAQQRRNHRMEHVFTGLAQMGGRTLRAISLARARLHLNWKVAAYNWQRLVYLKEAGVVAF